MKRPLTGLAPVTLLAALTALAPLGAKAAPPNPTLPTGACAGIVKDATLITYDFGDSFEGTGTHVSFYLDFDNLEAYITEVEQSVRNGEEDSRSLILAEGTPFSMTLSDDVPYAITGAFEIRDPETGEVDSVEGRLIPVNGGTTYFVEVLGGNPLTGICQKI